jgi:adenylate cyclase
MSDGRLHTFLFADISGYSALTEQDGDEAAAELAISFASEVARMAEQHGGELVKTIGDAVEVHCLDAAEAIALGLRLQSDLAALPPLHIGIHTGPALERAGDWWGATVNVAARVTASAGAGQLLITEATKQAAGRLSRTVHGLGPLAMKNIAAPLWVYSPYRSDVDAPEWDAEALELAPAA